MGWSSVSSVRSVRQSTATRYPWAVRVSVVCSRPSARRRSSVSVDRLVDAVWGDEEPPAGASRSVLSYVSRLRSALGNRYVTTRVGGLCALRRRRRDRCRRVREVAGRVQRMRRWRRRSGSWTRRCRSGTGGPSATWPTKTGAARPRSGSRSCAWSAWRRAARPNSTSGSMSKRSPSSSSSSPSTRSVKRSAAQLLLALFRSGRQADALRSFQEYRRLLGEETGLEPSRDLLELERRIAVADPALQFVTHGTNQAGLRAHRRAGRGPFGTVHRAVQPAVGREVAVKVVRPALADDPDFVRSFDGEARLVARLEHPHIVPLYDYWREPAGGAYLVMRLPAGREPGSCEAGHRAVAARPTSTRLLEEIGSALAAAHDAGVVHGDVKPANVLFDEHRQRVPDGLRDRHGDLSRRSLGRARVHRQGGSTRALSRSLTDGPRPGRISTRWRSSPGSCWPASHPP